MSDVMIAARGLTKRYGPHRALDNATFEVKKGEIVGLLGPNGAGKSTTMKILTCYIAPSEGTAAIRGCDIWDDPIGARASIGYLPESTPLYGEMLVAEYLEFMGEMRGLRGEALRKAIKKVVDECTLGAFFAQEIRTLSKGQRQRVGLSQALIHEPPILILDEPMSGLDPNQAVEIRDLIRQLGKERTVILSTHNLAEVQVTCQRVLIISKGKLVADDTPAALTSKGRNRYTVVVSQASKAYRDQTARDAFAKIKGVDSVRVLETEGGETKIEILPAGKDDLRGEVFKAAVDAGLTLLELRMHAQNLEQIFRDLTMTPSEQDDDEDEEEEDDKPAAKASASKASTSKASASKDDDEDEDDDDGGSEKSDAAKSGDEKEKE